MTMGPWEPEVLWLWNGDLQPHVLDAQLDAIRHRGFRTVGIWPWSGLLVPLLSAEYLDRISRTCATAARLGMRLWLAPDLNWPSGTAGGAFLEQHSEFRQAALLCTSRWMTADDPRVLTWRGEGEQLLAALALNDSGGRYDLAKPLEESGHPAVERRLSRLDGYAVEWQADLWEAELRLPAGEWFVTIASIVHTRPLLAGVTGTPWCTLALGAPDVLSAEATAAYIAYTIEPLIRAARPYLGTVVQGLLVHPPPALLPHAVAAPVGWRLDVLPWTATMPDLFEQLHGKPIETHLPYVLSPLHVEQEATTSPLDAWIEAVKRQYQTSLHDVLEQWCRSNRLRMRAVDARVLPHVPYSVLGERKRALAPGTLIEIQVGAMDTLPPSAHVAAAPSAARSRTEAEWVAVPILADTWEWQPAGLNWLALGEWSQWEAGADGETFQFRGSFVAEFVPEEFYALFEAGAVQSLSINGITVPLEAARRPEPHEIEFADESYRIVPLAPEAIRMSGINVVEASATIAPRILLDGGCTAGPLALAGTFAILPFTAQDVLSSDSALAVQEEAWRLVRPPGLVTVGDWGSIGYPRLTGHARYVQTFPLRGIPAGMRAQLIVDVQGALDEVRINERSAPRLGDAPAIFELTESLRTGLNRLEIVCRSGLAARLTSGSHGGLLAVRLEVDRSPQVILDTMRQESQRNW